MADQSQIGLNSNNCNNRRQHTAEVWIWITQLVILVVLSACKQPQSPTPNPIVFTEPQAAYPSPTIDPQRMPSLAVITSVVMPDTSLWYAFDHFDDIGGVPPDAVNQGLYRLKDDEVSHYDIGATIRVLENGLDSSLYVGAGCGVMRYANDSWETLLETNCGQQEIVYCLVPLEIAFDDHGTVWVGGPYCLAAYNGESWIKFDIPASRVLAAANGSIWTRGWDGKQDSSCCISHISGGQWTTYTLAADIPVDDELLNELLRESD